MTFTNNLKELKGYLKRGARAHRSRMETVHHLYADKNSPNCNTTLNMDLPLAFPTIYNPTKTGVQYQKRTAKYRNAVPITGRLERKIYALKGVSVAKDDLKKVRTGLTLSFNKHKDGTTKSSKELMVIHKVKMRSTSLEALEAKKKIKINHRVQITYVTIVKSFDGEINEQTVKSPMTTNSA